MKDFFSMLFLFASGGLAWGQVAIFTSSNQAEDSVIVIMAVLTGLSYLAAYMLYGGDVEELEARMLGALSLFQTLGLGIAIAVITISQEVEMTMTQAEYTLLIVYAVGFGVFGVIGATVRGK